MILDIYDALWHKLPMLLTHQHCHLRLFDCLHFSSLPPRTWQTSAMVLIFALLLQKEVRDRERFENRVHEVRKFKWLPFSDLSDLHQYLSVLPHFYLIFLLSDYFFAFYVRENFLYLYSEDSSFCEWRTPQNECALISKHLRKNRAALTMISHSRHFTC